VLQLPDATAGQTTPVRPARPGVLTIWVASPDQPRPCLVADLVSRVAERHHLRATVSGPAQARWDALNVHPAGVAAGPPAPLDVAVAEAGEPTGPAAHRIRPGEVRPQVPDPGGLDPLALRLALLRHRYPEPVSLTRQDLESAGAVLRDWREMVRRWALSPSRPMCAQYVGDFLGALDDGLDVPSALRTLSALAADREIPDGSKFEAFAYLDRFLGLDLAREVGR
jgi:hypothetical protein